MGNDKTQLKSILQGQKLGVFSLLAVFIIIALYAVFLGDTITGGMEDVEGIDFLMNSWIIAGILAVISMTSTLGAFGIMVEDRAKKDRQGFYGVPIGRGSLAGGYIFCAFAVGVIMSLLALVAGEIFIVASGGEVLSMENMLKVIGGIFSFGPVVELHRAFYRLVFQKPECVRNGEHCHRHADRLSYRRLYSHRQSARGGAGDHPGVSGLLLRVFPAQ